VFSDIENLGRCTPAEVVVSSEWTSIVNRMEKNRANFRKGLNGKPHFSVLYGLYTLTLNELKAVLKVSAQAGRNGAVNKTLVESMAQEDNFQKVKRHKRHISNDTSESQEVE
jgi:hypothetical protein